MKKVLFLISAVLWVALCPAFVKALAVEIIPSTHKVQQWDFTYFDLKTHNDLGAKNSFLVSIEGPYLQWKMPGDVLLVLNDGETKTSKIIFRPTKEGKFDYKVRVTPLSNPDFFVEKDFSLEVLGGIGLKNLRTNIVGQSLKVSMDIMSLEERRVILNMEVLDSEGMVVTSSERPITVKGIQNIQETISLDGVLAGSYKFRAFTGDKMVEKNFENEAFSNIVREYDNSPGILRDEVVIVIRNEGNVIENFVVKENVGTNELTGFVTRPTDCMTTPDSKDCDFGITGLVPGEERRIIYTVEHWPNYAKYVAGLIILVLIGTYSAGEITKPRIKKKIVKRSNGTHTVILEIKNPIKELDSVIIRDFVSPLARVHKSFEHLKPVSKTSDAGTELIWKIGKMKPREERVLSYRMKPLVGGELKMPKAYLRFRNNKGERIRVFSKHLMV